MVLAVRPSGTIDERWMAGLVEKRSPTCLGFPILIKLEYVGMAIGGDGLWMAILLLGPIWGKWVVGLS